MIGISAAFSVKGCSAPHQAVARGDSHTDSVVESVSGATSSELGAGGTETPAPTASASQSPAVNATSDVTVHVTGEVATPGVYTLPEDARIIDAVDAAGGFGPSADSSALNLAQPLADGVQIIVLATGQEATGFGAPSAPENGSAQNGDSASGTSGPTGLVNINTADASELESLPGIGPAIAQRIIDYRTQNGRFSSIEDLDDVSGIGPALMEQLRSRISV